MLYIPITLHHESTDNSTDSTIITILGITFAPIVTPGLYNSQMGVIVTISQCSLRTLSSLSLSLSCVPVSAPDHSDHSEPGTGAGYPGVGAVRARARPGPPGKLLWAESRHQRQQQQAAGQGTPVTENIEPQSQQQLL